MWKQYIGIKCQYLLSALIIIFWNIFTRIVREMCVYTCVCRLTGSYSSLKGGNISEGMEDFTGGIAYTRPVSSRTPPVLWRTLTAALSRGSLLSCFIQVYTQIHTYILYIHNDALLLKVSSLFFSMIVCSDIFHYH